MGLPTEEEAFEVDEYYKNHPEEVKYDSQYESELDELEKKIKELKDKGIITREFDPDQGMAKEPKDY